MSGKRKANPRTRTPGRKAASSSSSPEGYGLFPDELPVHLSYTEFPSTHGLCKKLEFPLGMVARPFIPMRPKGKTANTLSKLAKEIARCSECSAYINPYCEISSQRWFCSLCGRRNVFQRHQTRYKYIEPKLLPELNDIMLDYDIPLSDNADIFSVPATVRPLIHLFLINECMEIDALQAVIDSISEAAQVAHGDVHFGLVTFSNRIGLYTLSAGESLPVIQYIHVDSHSTLSDNQESDVPSQPGDHLSVALSSVIDFKSFIRSFHDCRSSLASAVSAIIDVIPEQREMEESGADVYGSLEVTMQAILDWIEDSSFFSSHSDTLSSFSNNNNKQSTNSTSVLGTVFSLLTGATPEQVIQPPQMTRECSYLGVIVHCFVDHKEVLEFSNHSNSQEEVIGRLQQRCNNLHTTINLHAVCSFDSAETSLHHWQPIVDHSGGHVTRYSLGIHPRDEKLRLQEDLRRVLTRRYATKCRFKLRTMPALHVLPGKVFGPVTEDTSNSNVFGAGTMDEYSCISMLFDVQERGVHVAWTDSDSKVYSSPSMNDNQSGGVDVFVFQFAFSFESLVEDEGVVDDLSEPWAMSPNSPPDYEEVKQYLHEAMGVFGTQWQECLHQLFQANDPTLMTIMKRAQQKIQYSNSTNRSLPTAKRYSALNTDKRLIVRKFLRVCTICVEANRNLQQIQELCHVPTAVSLVLKEAVQNARCIPHVLTAASSEEEKSQVDQGAMIGRGKVDRLISKLNIGNSAVKEMINGIVEFVRLNVANIKQLSCADAVVHLFNDRHSREALKLLYTCLVRLLPEEGSYNISGDETPDVITDWMSRVVHSNPIPMLSCLVPTLVPLDEQLLVDTELSTISLRRDVLLSCGRQLFLLDAGRDLVLYHAIGGNMLYSQSAQQQQRQELVGAGEDDQPRYLSIIPHIVHRLLDYPYMPKFIVAEAGTPSAAIFSSYMIDDQLGLAALTFEEMQLLVVEILKIFA